MRAAVVEIGASRVALGIFRRVGDRLEVEAGAIEPLTMPPFEADQWVDDASEAIGRLGARVRYRGPVIATLPGHLLLSKHVKTPRVQPDKQGKVVCFEAAQSIPLPLDQVVWDHLVVGEHANATEVLLIAAKSAAVSTLCRGLERAGLAPETLLPAPLATLAAVRWAHGPATASRLLLNLGARTSHLLWETADGLVLRCLPLGGQQLTRQISEQCGCSWNEAEDLKQASPPAADVQRIGEEFARRLGQEITRTVLHFSRLGRFGEPGSLAAVGGGARMAGLPDALSAQLGMPVQPVDWSGRVQNCPVNGGTPPRNDWTEEPDVLGAALIHTGLGGRGMNLLPPRIRARRSIRRRLPGVALTALLLLVALAVPGIHYHRVGHDAARKARVMESEIAPLRAIESENQAVLQRIATLRRRITAIENVRARRHEWVAWLADLQTRLAGAGPAWIERMTVAPLADGGVGITIAGRAGAPGDDSADGSTAPGDLARNLRVALTTPPVLTRLEQQRFALAGSGQLEFEFLLVPVAARPL